jgi:4-amino-4-deoxy-L-arabinose transferase-like glycosyltransferase
MKNANQALKFLKENWQMIALIAIMILSIYVRSYHIDYPVIGYHNTKEAHTLAEAYFMYEGGEYFVNKGTYNIAFSNPDLKHMDNFPLLSWIIVLLWKIFGVDLALARYVIVLFSAGTVFFTFFVVQKLFDRPFLSLLSSFYVAICPLLIFFGRSVQFDMPALFFMMASIFYFFNWREKPTDKNFLLFLVFFTLAGLTKMIFLIIVIPILAVFPYERLDIRKKSFKKKYLKQFLYAIPFFLALVGILLYSSHLSNKYEITSITDIFGKDDLPKLTTKAFWTAVYNYAKIDNFTTWGVWFAIFGLMLMLPKIKRWNYRFLVVWFLSYIIYAAFSPNQMTGHNYYQMPYAPLIMILSTYFLYIIFNSVCSSFIKKPFQRQVAIILAFAIVMVFWYPSLKLSTTRQFDTQFFGLDIAGEYIYQNSQPGQTIFESGHQDRGLAWHSKRRLLEFNNVKDFKRAEDELNLSWVFVYQWGFSSVLGKQEIKDYVYSTYSIKQVALRRTPQGYSPLYFLFNKGGSFNESELNTILENSMIQTREYELTTGTVVVDYVNI